MLEKSSVFLVLAAIICTINAVPVAGLLWLIAVVTCIGHVTDGRFPYAVEAVLWFDRKLESLIAELQYALASETSRRVIGPNV